MQRRDLMKLVTAATASGAALRGAPALTQPADDVPDEVDPYFLDAGELTNDEQEDVVAVAELQQRQMQGQQVVIPRDLAPARAPTYRFVHWNREIGDPQGRFVSPLSTQSQLRALPAYRLNAQILGFRGASEDWRSRSNQGTLTVEMRAQVRGEPMTWLFAQQFEMDNQGFSTLGSEYVAQREGSSVPAVTDQPSIGLRIQLMRSTGRAAAVLRKFISTALAVTGVLQSAAEIGRTRTQPLPPLRVPAMVQEGAAVVQAVIGGTATEAPIWRGGFSSYSLAPGGSRLGLVPGYWMAIDASREPDLRGVSLEDLGGFLAPVRDGQRLDANYLVLAFEIDGGAAPPFLNIGPRVVPRGPADG